MLCLKQTTLSRGGALQSRVFGPGYVFGVDLAVQRGLVRPVEQIHGQESVGLRGRVHMDERREVAGH